RLIGYVRMAADSLTNALEQGAKTHVLDLPILPEGERRDVLFGYNPMPVAFPDQALIHERFELQAQLHPDAPAVICADRALTFAELNSRANQLARCLRDRGIGPDVLVGICIERSVDLMVALLATLKAGGAYVPLDPDYPADRLAYLIRDAAPRVVLT